ncbi:hypothetical protein ACH4SK_10945 [Streptomyces inhibens]|uniref:hypothetical protein n=1 Tax=Streptomyces inhibens TaxID=2293571 RepID=UPI0037AB77FD
MRKTVATLVAAATVAVITTAVAGCSDNGGGSAPSKPPTPTPTRTSAAPSASPSAAAWTVTARSGPLGTILVDGRGRTLYLFEADRTSGSTCYGGCAKEWPPMLVTHAPKAAGGVRSDLLGTTTRDDGTKEVTYNHHPLYYFDDDKKPGDTHGQGIDDSGGKWFVLDINGNKIVKAPRSATPSSTPSAGTGGGY